MSCPAVKRRRGVSCLLTKGKKPAWKDCVRFRFILAKAKGTGDKSVGGWSGGEDEWVERANYFYDTAVRHVPYVCHRKCSKREWSLMALWALGDGEPGWVCVAMSLCFRMSLCSRLRSWGRGGTHRNCCACPIAQAGLEFAI